MSPPKSPKTDLVIPTKLSIGSPCSGENFDGTASGIYVPPTLSPTSIEYHFWKHVDDGVTPTGEGDMHGDASYPYPVAGMWMVDFDLPVGSDTKGYLKVVMTANSQKYGDFANNLTWPPAGTLVTKTKSKAKADASATPNVLIKNPNNADLVPRLFLVHGEFNSGDGNTVSVKLLRWDGTKAVATILPVEYPYGIQWVTAILSYEGGPGYRILARLIDKHGKAVPPASSVTIAIS